MAKVKLSAGAELDLLTQGEVDDSLMRALNLQEYARGQDVKVLRAQGTTGTVTATAGAVVDGPNPGYAWALRGAYFNLATASNVRLWIIGDNNTAVAGAGLLQGVVAATSSATFNSVTWSGVQAVLHGGENLLISTAGSVASIGYTFYYVEVPEQLLWKLA